MMKIAILGNQSQPKFAAVVDLLIAALQNYPVDFQVCDNLPTPIQGFDLAISVGGDGTFLESAIRVGSLGIPIIGINAGRLGFLTDNSEDDLSALVNDLCNNNFSIEERSLLELVTPNDQFDFNFALNEIAVLKKDSSSMITVHTSVNNHFVNSFWCDGLLIVTPTGSTAYSLSVGGPIMTPNAKTLIITPVAPHSLTVRPIVVSDDVEIKLSVSCRSDSFLLAIDSRSTPMEVGSELIIRKAKHAIQVIERKDHNFYNTLRKKLLWGADQRN